MPVPVDKHGDPEITVADIVAYLLTLPQDAAAFPDRDGWLQEEIKADTTAELIAKRGLFSYYPSWGLCINN